MEDRRAKAKDVDGGWAWVALVATVLTLTLQASLTIAVGLFLVEFPESFEASKGFIALIGALAVSGQTLLGPIAGILSNILSHRVVIMIGISMVTLGLVCASFSQNLSTLLAFFGIMSGLGAGLSYSPAVTAISTYFCKYRTIANGISLGSPGIGVMVAPYLLGWLIQSYGWRFAMVAYGCFVAQGCVLAALLFPHNTSPTHTHTPTCCVCPSKSKTPPPGDDPESESLQAPMNHNLRHLKDLRNAEIKVMVGSRTAMHVSEFGSVLMSNSVVWTVEEVKSGTFRRLKHLLSRQFMWVMCLNQLLLMGGLSINTVLFPSYAHSIGITYDNLRSVYTVFGVTLMVCRVSGGFIFSLIPQHMLKVFFCLQVCVAVIMALLPVFGTTLDSLFVYKFLMGATYGPTFLLVTPILIHYVGLEDLSVAFGVVMLSCGFGYIIAPPLGGLMYDFFGSYRISYYIAGSTVGAGALSLLLLLAIKDLQPVEDADLKQDSLTGSSQKESEGSEGSSEVRENKPVEKDGVQFIDDMEDLCKFIDNRHS